MASKEEPVPGPVSSLRVRADTSRRYDPERAVKRAVKKDKTGSYIWSYHTETPSERKLSQGLKKAGLRFSQEVHVKGFTVDFLVDEWLIVEVDGESHLISGRIQKDASRQKLLEDSGFTVLRIPASDLSVQGGLNRWVNRIKELVASPPHLNRGKFENRDYQRQLAAVRKALAEGEEERKKRESLAYEKTSGKHSGEGAPSDEDEESMEDYFGKDAEDFASLLDKYDWNPPQKLDNGPGGGSWGTRGGASDGPARHASGGTSRNASGDGFAGRNGAREGRKGRSKRGRSNGRKPR